MNSTDSYSSRLNLKTGVALGLLDLLPGEPTGFVIRNRSSDAEYSAQAPFKFYVGKKKQGKLDICLQKNEDYGLWHKLDTVKKSAVTRLYFTTDPRILEDGSLACTEYKLEHTEDSIGLNLFIRATGPNTLEWIAIDGEKVQDSQSGQSIVLK